MISNLLTSLLIATAVGGTTATAFGNEPNRAIENIGTDRYQIENNVENSFQQYIDQPYTTDAYVINSCYVEDNYNNMISYESKHVFGFEQQVQLQSGTTMIYYGYSIYHFTVVNTNIHTLTLDTSHTYLNLSLGATAPGTLEMQQSVTAFSMTAEEAVDRDLYEYLYGGTPQSKSSLNLALQYINYGLEDAYDSHTNTVNISPTNVGTTEQIVFPSTFPLSYNIFDRADTEFYLFYLYTANITDTIGPNENYILYGNSYKLMDENMTLLTNTTTVTTTYEVIDIPGLMYTVLTMPFSFISQAFNLKLFAGTPYAINIGHIVLLLATIMILLFIAKIIIKFLR